jgi:hypothetical protein
MAQKRLNDPSQLELFAHAQPERTPQLRPDGGNPLAPALSPDGAAIDAAGAAASGVFPPPVKIGRSSRVLRTEIATYLDQLCRQRGDQRGAS